MPPNDKKLLKSCRLCQLHPGTFHFSDNHEFIDKVLECTKIKINNEHMHLLPKSVCPSCKLSIEVFYVFLKDIQLVDQRLQDQFLNYNSQSLDKYSAVIPKRSLLKKQLQESDNPNRLTCPVCSKTYARIKSLQLHKRRHINLYCSKCDSTFTNTIACKNHKCEALEDNVECKDSGVLKRNNIDDLKVIKKTGRTKHEVVKKEWFEDEFPADGKDVKPDDKISSTGVVLVNNVITSEMNHSQLSQVGGNMKHKFNGGRYTCEVCSENFVSNMYLRLHQKVHGNSFSCTYKNCKKLCSSAYSLRTHLMRHEGKMPFLCVTCGKGFTTKNSLTCHEQTHAIVKRYACLECNIGFSVASNLRAHQKKHHEGVRFYCSQCTRAFITKCSLERHELVHAGVKEFKCETCQAAFYTNKELLKHQRYHQGLRLYKCDQCYKTFFEKHHLTIHIRVHTGERPYACKIPGCGKSFTESQKLTRHAKARHPPV